MRLAYALVLTLAACSSVQARPESTHNAAGTSDLQAVQQRADYFIQVFNQLDWDRFRRVFADDATVFFPFAEVPRRASGRREIEATFKPFFDEVRKRRPGPNYLNISPKDVKVQMLGEVAIVTFHLGGDERPGRRSVVFQKQKDDWLIVHLHASPGGRAE